MGLSEGVRLPYSSYTVRYNMSAILYFYGNTFIRVCITSHFYSFYIVSVFNKDVCV